MELAKPQVDIGLIASRPAASIDFWSGRPGARFDHLLPIRKGMRQHRLDLMGSVVKINETDPPPAQTPRAGYVGVIVACPGLTGPEALVDPDGLEVLCAPSGEAGIDQIAVRVRVRDPEAQARFYSEGLGLERAPCGAGLVYAVGRSRLIIEADPAAPQDAAFDGVGFRYVTLQSYAVDTDHARALSGGGREGSAPRTLGTTARISMVIDPAGNWIEISQRASLTGSLEPR